ncbi:hypothetical protein X777_05701 [Ooceraea biroi]|uniref:Uncharacterized protein n=1 Tax=Ooceraea biroi TaxID=2015173 RepID=A0A026WEN8_OOCBI|nr:hypothetical protein X777_05701 [Ooceraea biroi]
MRSISIWAGIIGNTIIGSHFLPDNLRGVLYLNFSHEDLPQLLEDAHGEAPKTGHLNISAVIGDRKKCVRPNLWTRRGHMKVNFVFLNGICFFTYHLVERLKMRTLIYGSKSFKITEGQLQGKIIYFILPRVPCY